MKYKLEIEIDTQATDSNRILGVNKYVKHEIFKKVKLEVAALTVGKRPLKPLTSFAVSVVRYGAKPLDYDNLISSLKPFIDGLKLASIIEDDKWDYIKDIPVDQVKSKEKKLIIKVEEV